MEDRPSRPLGLIEIAVEPTTYADGERLLAALARLSALDPLFSWTTDPESGQTIVTGVSERQLDDHMAALGPTYHIDARVGAPQVAYRETIGRAATVDYTHKKLTGASGQFARVNILFEPLPPGAGFVFENAITGGAIPSAFIPGVEKGLRAQKENGLIAGFPLIDFKATLIDGAYHDLDSNVLTFEIAARAALRELAQKGGPVLLEPIMSVEIVAPKDCLDAIYADLDKRRANVLGTAKQDAAYRVTATVPLANLFGYNDALGSISAGRAQFTMTFHRYEQVPARVASPDDDPRFPPAGAQRAAAGGRQPLPDAISPKT